MENNNGRVTLALLKQEVDAIKTKQEKHDKIIFGEHGILTNHIPHIQQSIVSLKTRMSVLTAVNIAAIVLGVLATKL